MLFEKKVFLFKKHRGWPQKLWWGGVL